MSGQKSLWPTIREEFFRDLTRLQEKMGGPWDLVLFTGDLTYRGVPGEFDELEDNLAKLWELFKKLDSNPILLAVPGNHDLSRPSAKRGTVKAIARWWEDQDIRDEFWKEEPNEYRGLIEEVFKPYTDWQRTSRFHEKRLTPGLLPGDFSCTFEKDNLRLGIVGLNSAFLQLTGEEHQGRLSLDSRQFQAACSDDSSDWLASHDATILLTHHPQDWLGADAATDFQHNILARDNFTLHLFGHMHEGSSVSTRRGGSSSRRSIQGPSLFGLEEFGEQKKAHRVHGYGAGCMDFEGDGATLSFWPRTSVVKQSGFHALEPDPTHELDDRGAWTESFTPKRGGRGPTPVPNHPPAQPAPPEKREKNKTTARPRRPAPSAGEYTRLHGQARAAVTRLSTIGKGLGWKSVAKQGEALLEVLQQEPYRVVITGRSRAGKSTLLNAMVGRLICPVKRTRTTAVPIIIAPGEKEVVTVLLEKEAPHRIDGPVTKDMLSPYADDQNNPRNIKGVSEIRVVLADEVLDLGVMYVDIPGFDDPNRRIGSTANDVIQSAHALVFVLDVSTVVNGGFSLDGKTIELLQGARDRKCPVFVVCNKAEGLNAEDRKLVVDDVRSTLEQYDLWAMLQRPPFFMSASKASVTRERKDSDPPDYEAFHDALWESLWKTDNIGMHRLHRVFEQLLLASNEVAVLISSRQAQEPDRVRLHRALDRFVAEWNEIYDGCNAVIAHARKSCARNIRSAKGSFQAEIRAWIEALPADQELPRPSKAIASLREPMLERWNEVLKKVEHEIKALLVPLDQRMRESLAALSSAMGSSTNSKQQDHLLQELAAWKEEVATPNPEHGGRYVAAILGAVSFGLAAIPFGLLIGGVVASVVSAVAGLFSDHADTPAELQESVTGFFDNTWSELERNLGQEITKLERSLNQRTYSRMNPFTEDVRGQLDDIRAVSPEELQLFAEMKAEIHKALESLRTLLRSPEEGLS
jgi:GTP-binding protein EngB required for normal cell division/predicted MPP superfamily phosphohydrolase